MQLFLGVVHSSAYHHAPGGKLDLLTLNLFFGHRTEELWKRLSTYQLQNSDRLQMSSNKWPCCESHDKQHNGKNCRNSLPTQSFTPAVLANQNSNANLQISLKHPPNPEVPLPAAAVANTQSAKHRPNQRLHHQEAC